MFAEMNQYKSATQKAENPAFAPVQRAAVQFMCQTVANAGTCSATCHGLGLKKGNCSENANACRCCE